MPKQIDVNARNITVATAIVLILSGLGGIGGSIWRLNPFTGTDAQQLKTEVINSQEATKEALIAEIRAVELRNLARLADLKAGIRVEVIRLDGRIDDLPPPLLQKQVDRNTANIGRHKENQTIHSPHREAK